MIDFPIRLPEFGHAAPLPRQYRRALEPIEPEEVLALRLANAGRPLPSENLPVDQFVFDDSSERIPFMRIPANRDSSFDTTPRVLLNAGTHGDERAPVYELASMIAERALPREFAYDVVLNVNPHGFRQHTCENLQGQDIDRSFFNSDEVTREAMAFRCMTENRKYIAAIDLHEDFTAEGCYSYEAVADFDHHTLGAALVKNWQAEDIPLQTLSPEGLLGPIAGSHEIVHRYTPGSILTDAAAEMLAYGDRQGMLLTTQMLLSGQTKSALRVVVGQVLDPATRRTAQKSAVLSALQAILDDPAHFAEPQITVRNVEAVRALRGWE